MYPPPLDYHRAADVTEALSLLADLPDATVLAGGHALIPRLKDGRADPGAVVDVSDVPELSGVDVGDEATVVGAATTYADLLEARADDGTAVLDRYAPAFAEAVRAVGDRQIRNRGTVGGNLAAAHPDSDPPAAALVADASIRIRGPDEDREVPVAEFLDGPFESAVADDELVTAVRIPHVEDGNGADADDGGDGLDGGEVAGDDKGAADDVAGGAYVKKTHPTSGYAMVGVAARVVVADGVLSSVRVAANGVADVAVRLPSVEAALSGIDLEDADADERLREGVADAAADVPEAVRRGDVHASAAYRASVLPTHVERAVRAAVEDAATATDGGVDSAADGRGGEPR